MKILIYKGTCLINSPGGAEKVMCNMANTFVEDNYEVLFLTRDTKEGKTFFKLNNKVILKQHNIQFNKIRRGIGKLLTKMGKIDYFPYFDRDLQYSTLNNQVIKEYKPDIIIATSITDAKELIYKQDKIAPIVVTMHSCPNYFFNNKKKKQDYINTLKKVDVVQVLQPSFVEETSKYYSGNIVVIGNIVNQINESADINSKTIICVSRIEDGKGQYEAVEAFAQIAKNMEDWQLDFWGYEEQPKYKEKCINLAKQYHIEDRVNFRGVSSEIMSEIKKASICLYPSKFEGFSLALTEALSIGLPCIGFKNSIGVNEIIKDGINGFLVKDSKEMAEKCLMIMKDMDLHKRLSIGAKKSMQEYAPDIICNEWKKLVHDVVMEKGKKHEF